jgi:hypothetical protein
MGILGSQVAGTDFAEYTVSGSRPSRLEVKSYTPAEDELITELYFYCDGSSAQVYPIGIYRADTDALVHTLSITLPGVSGLAWCSTTGLSAALTSGVEYKIAAGCPPTSTVVTRTATAAGGMSDANVFPDLPSTWAIQNSVYNKELGLYAVTESAVQDPSVTTTNTLKPGEAFTLTATNFASAPVSPVTLTDSQGSTITVPVTISGSGPYTATGTMPTIAEAVTAGTSLLFGDVTIELST